MIKTEENKIVMYFVKELLSGVVAGLRTVIETNVLYCLIELNYSLGSMQSLHTLSDDWGVCPFYLPSEFLQLDNITLTVIGQYNKSKPQLVKPYFFYYFLFFIYIFFVCVCFFCLFLFCCCLFLIFILFFCFVLF